MEINKADKKSRRFFAIVSLGGARWYWVVWPSLAELQESEEPPAHIAEGYEKTKAMAVEKALELGGMYAEWIATKYARAYLHNTKISLKQKKEHGAHIAGSAKALVMHEFLYREVYDSATQQWASVPYRVTRRTKKYIYVEQHPYSGDALKGSWLDGEHSTYRLDRQALDQEGYAFIPASSYLSDQEEPLFFNYERASIDGGPLLKCLEVLHLSWPCTAKDVQKAYRGLVRSAHPDGGGSHDKFLELQAAYKQALRLCH